jgi:hypothetical protein
MWASTRISVLHVAIKNRVSILRHAIGVSKVRDWATLLVLFRSLVNGRTVLPVQIVKLVPFAAQGRDWLAQEVVVQMTKEALRPNW